MSQVSLLDCTLRDGGYLNDWRFGHGNLVSVFERLVDSGVDIIEIGFLDERRPFDIDRSIMPDTESVEKIYGLLDSRQAMVVGMIDYGTCGLRNVQPCEKSYLDGIRVIFKKHLMHPAMEFCRELKKLGYKVFSQLVSITSYNDEELLELVDLVNDVKPYAVSMVDTYGLLYPEELLHYYEILDQHVDLQVQVGFHAHNNLQLAYANSLAFLNKSGRHDIVVDGTLYGMGKGAGNAPLELFAVYLNERFGKQYRVDSMLEGINESIKDFYAKTPWGYQTFFYLCGKNRCHPNYLTYLNSTQNLSLSNLDMLLGQIEPEDKKLLYDESVAGQLYESYLNNEGSDTVSREAFAEMIKGKSILLIGPGRNIRLQGEKVQRFIEEETPFVISINYIPEQMDINCVFVTNSKRYHDMTLALKEKKNAGIKLLATSNVECRNGRFDFVINRAPLLEKNEKIVDNSFLMLVKFLNSIGVQEVFCAGFDGYSDKESNYYNPSMEYAFIKQEAPHLNRHIKSAIAGLRQTMNIQFITYSAYDVEEDINGAAI